MNVLAIGPHPDDIELGCYGTLKKHVQNGDKVYLSVLTSGGIGGDIDQRETECREAAKLLGAEEIFLMGLIDTKISDGVETIVPLERLIKKINPDLIYTIGDKDTHQDHRNSFNATVSAARDIKKILVYEAPSVKPTFSPNYFVDISDYIDEKVKAVALHKSQGKRIYMAENPVKGLASYRASLVREPNSFYEAFEVYRIKE